MQALIRTSPFLFPLLWSTGFIGAKYGFPYIQPLSFLALRFVVVLLIFVGIVLVLKPAMPTSRQAYKNLFIAGLLIHGIYLAGVFIAIKLGLPAGIAAVVVGIQPVLTVLLVDKLQSLALLLVALLGFVGLLLVLSIAGASTSSNEVVPNIAYLPVIVSLFAITCGTVFQKRTSSGINVITSTFLQYIPTTIFFVIAAVIFERHQFAEIIWHADLFFAIFWLTMVLSIGAVLLMNLLYKYKSANIAASYFYLSPPFALLIAYFLFDEQLTFLNVVGICLVVLSIYLTSFFTKKLSIK